MRPGLARRGQSAHARLPRYFPDTDRVQDLSRACDLHVALQGFKPEEAMRIPSRRPGASNLEALASYVAGESKA